jgi:hypothetical protein
VGGETEYYTHTSYRIYSDSGKFFKYVSNSDGDMDESPMLVTIPAGKYDIHAQSDFGPVIVPILIHPGETTMVNLISAEAKKSRTTNDASVVWMPTGHAPFYYQVGPRSQEK